MTRTLLTSVNNTLNLVGENSIQSSSTLGGLGSLTKVCLTQSVTEVCTSGRWEFLRSSIQASTWSTSEATLPSTVFQIIGVYWYSSPTGSATSTFDYPTFSLTYVTPEQFKSLYLFPYSDTANCPSVWTRVNYNVIGVNPYPTSVAEKAKVRFDVFSKPDLPSTDATNWSATIPDFFLDLVETHAASSIALSHLQDKGLYDTLFGRYLNLQNRLRVHTQQMPATGYSMYKKGRTRNRGL